MECHIKKKFIFIDKKVLQRTFFFYKNFTSKNNRYGIIKEIRKWDI